MGRERWDGGIKLITRSPFALVVPCAGRDVGQGIKMSDKELRVMAMSDAMFFEKQRLAMKYEAQKAGLL